MLAIWISPMPENTPGGYHGYWAKDLTKVNSHFGTEEDLKQLVSECHKRDIWVMLDVVANHMGYHEKGHDDYSTYFPFNRREHYHDCNHDINNWYNQGEIENCRLSGLPDLKQENPYVADTLKQWVSSTVQKYQLDGLRINTIPEVPKWFWEDFRKSAGVFTIGEALNRDFGYVADYQNYIDSVLNYPMYYKLIEVYKYRKSMREIHNGVEAQKHTYKDVSILGNFVDSHDVGRFLSWISKSDYALLCNALAYVIFAEGIPIIYYGTEQGFNGDTDPTNRESLWPHFHTEHVIYQLINKLAHFRQEEGSALYDSSQIERYVDDQFFSFSRGQVLVCTTNTGPDQAIERVITYHPFKAGNRLINILDSSDTVTVTDHGIPITMTNGMPKVYHIDGSSGGRSDEL